MDFNLPERLGASFIGDDSQRRVPVMLHRAMFGSLERFCGILLEHHAGRLPTWLAPVQVVVLNITDRQAEFAGQGSGKPEKSGRSGEVDLRNEKIGFKIREHTLQRVPYLVVVGDREVRSKTLAVRTRGGKDLGTMPLERLAQGLPPRSRAAAALLWRVEVSLRINESAGMKRSMRGKSASSAPVANRSES